VRGGKVTGLLVCFVLATLLFSFAAFATTVDLEIVDNQITPAERASFSLTLTNDNTTNRQRYSIYSLTPTRGWSVDTSPLSDKIIELGPGRSYTTTIVAQPYEELTPGIYTIPVTVSSDLGENYDKLLKVYLSPENPVDYLPALSVTVDMDERIDPTQPLSIKLFVENRNPLNLTDLGIQIQSDIPEFTQSTTVSVSPLGKKSFEFSVLPDPHQQPKEYFLFFIFTHKGETVKIVEQRVEILPLAVPFTVEGAGYRKFLKSFGTYTVTNDGNTLNTQEIAVPIGFWKGLFTSGEESIKKVDGVRSLTWTVELAPGESVNFNTTTNYRWLLYVLIVLSAFGLFYWFVQAPVVITKNAQTVLSDSESLSEIKVTLEVRNRSRKPLKHLTVTDYVPGIANVDRNLELGTLKPTKVQHGKKKGKVVWSLAELDVGEHRIITYKIKAKLNIVGTFNLPRAVIEYKKDKNKKGKAYSNTSRLTT
jgi:hypothetical protein